MTGYDVYSFTSELLQFTAEASGFQFFQTSRPLTQHQGSNHRKGSMECRRYFGVSVEYGRTEGPVYP